MELIEYPPREKWDELCRRPRMDVRGLEKTCREVFSDIEKNGDEALMRYTERFDRIRVENPAGRTGRIRPRRNARAGRT